MGCGEVFMGEDTYELTDEGICEDCFLERVDEEIEDGSDVDKVDDDLW
jgi:hypothetical protein